MNSRFRSQDFVTCFLRGPIGCLRGIKFDVVGERPATKHIAKAERTGKSRKIASPQITAHIF